MMLPEYHGEVNNPMFCLDKLLTSHYLDVILRNKSYAQGGSNAGILREMQKKG
jgi:hypothetical protein